MVMKFDVAIIGGGLAGTVVAKSLLESGKKVVVISRGLSINNVSLSEIEKMGAIVLAGDTVVSGEFDGCVLKSICTEKLREVRIEADAFVLTTGGFFARGLYADMDKVYEPVFCLDVEYAENREEWFDADFSAPQPFVEFGVKVDQKGRASRGGVLLENVYAAGEVLKGVSSVAAASAAKIGESAMLVVESIK